VRSAEVNSLRASAGRVGALETENYRLSHEKQLLEVREVDVSYIRSGSVDN